mmetsp:Transcript_7584/g.24741  ORF Transcript_7584/g.24741 Transcript_7584/m.24741 type:complete len:816 (-) Transcript_7584:897-3344(-)
MRGANRCDERAPTARRHRGAMQLLLCVAWLGRSDALEASGLFRRRAVLAKTGTAAVAVAAPLVATAATDAELESNPALVWRPGETNSKRKTTCGTATRKVFPGAFVNYLSRFLLTYDRGSRVLWRADAEEIPLAWDAPKVKGKRAQQFAAFAASVEAGLCDYAEKSATEAGEPSETPQLGVRQLLSLLRSRYGDMPDAPRQLALTFSLLDELYQPRDAIALLSARAENATAVAVYVDDRGSFGALARDIDFAPASLVFRPALEGVSVAAKLGAPVLESTGKLLSLSVVDGGSGYEQPPAVRVSPPTSGGAAPSARAVLKDGHVACIELLGDFEGYNDGVISVDVDAPPVGAEISLAGEGGCIALAELEVQLISVAVDNACLNFGYTSAQALDVSLSAFLNANANVLRVIKAPKLRILLEASGPSEFPPRRGASDGAAGASLTALLQGKVPIWDGTRHRFPSPTFIPSTRANSVAVRRDALLTNGQLARLAAAGAVATAFTRGVLNPLEVSKTRKQAMLPADASTKWLGVDASAASGAALGMTSFGVFELLHRTLPKLAEAYTGDTTVATAYELQFSLVASAFSVVVAATTVAPFEKCKVRLMLSDDSRDVLEVDALEVDANHRAKSPKTTKNLATVLASSIRDEGFFALWDGLVPLLAREFPFTISKLTVYSSATESIFSLLPALRERPETSLAVAAVSGALAGACGAFLSTPADAIVTELGTGRHGSSWASAIDAVLTRQPPGMTDAVAAPQPALMAALPRLFTGAKERMLLFAVVITVQLLLFDFCRSLLGVSPEDLSLVLDVFADRLTFYDW